MKLNNQIVEDEVIAEFLLAEIHSSRFRKNIIKALGGHDLSIITEPDLRNVEENNLRKYILGEARGYALNEDLFENFPHDVKWYSASFTKQELCNVLYIDYSYWNELSNGTRLPGDAARNINNGVNVFGVSNEGFQKIHVDMMKGMVFPRLIFVSRNENSRIVVLEGHARLTAYLLDEEHIPEELEVIIGYSESFYQWDLY